MKSKVFLVESENSSIALKGAELKKLLNCLVGLAIWATICYSKGFRHRHLARVPDINKMKLQFKIFTIRIFNPVACFQLQLDAHILIDI